MKAGANLIITCEPRFYTHGDLPTASGATSVFLAWLRRWPRRPLLLMRCSTAKDDFLRKHNLLVWRFSEHWRLRTPDPYAQGLGAALGWSKFADATKLRGSRFRDVAGRAGDDEEGAERVAA